VTTTNAIDLYGHIPPPWKPFFIKNDIDAVGQFLASDRAGHWHPSVERIFRPLLLSADPGKVRVCLIGQDPYPEKSQPTGLPFSVDKNLPIDKIPSSLSIIFWELVRDLRTISPQQTCPSNGYLKPWTNFCLLWNAAPTCEVGKSGLHVSAWRRVSRHLMCQIEERHKPVFVAWGAEAKKVVPVGVPPGRRFFWSYSPSPRSAYRSGQHAFVGSQPFAKAANASGLNLADWRLPDRE
jgi:uracil-DNA glycosylase